MSSLADKNSGQTEHAATNLATVAEQFEEFDAQSQATGTGPETPDPYGKTSNLKPSKKKQAVAVATNTFGSFGGEAVEAAAEIFERPCSQADWNRC